MRCKAQALAILSVAAVSMALIGPPTAAKSIAFRTVAGGGEVGCSLAYDEACDVMVSITRTVWYVDNTAPSGGDGSSGSPFNNLQEAQANAGPGEVIFVRRGDGTANGQDQGIVLEDGQCLLGEDEPIITNSTGPAVILANHNVVAGIVALDAVSVQGCEESVLEEQGHGILGNRSAGFEIAGNQLLGNQCFGVGVVDGSASGIVACNTLEGNLGGVGTDNDDGTLDLTVAWNSIGAMNIGIFVGADDANGVRAARASGPGGISRAPDAGSEKLIGGPLSVEIVGNTLQDLAFGIQMEADGSNIEATIASNVIEDSSDTAIDIQSVGPSRLTLRLNDNVVDLVGDEAVSLEIDDGELNAWLVGNKITRFDLGVDQGAGIDLAATGPANTTLAIYRNEISDSATGDGINIHADAEATSVKVGNNCVARTQLGIDIQARSFGTVADLYNNLVADNVTGGIRLATEAGGVLPLILARALDNTLIGNAVSPNGFQAISTVGLGFCLDLQNNSSDTDYFLMQADPGTLFLETPAINEGTLVIEGGLTPVPRGACGFPIFFDGFESGDTSAWSGTPAPPCAKHSTAPAESSLRELRPAGADLPPADVEAATAPRTDNLAGQRTIANKTRR